MVFIITHPQENLYLLTSLLEHVQNQHSDLVNASRIGTCSWPHSTVSTDCVTACVRTSCKINKKWLNHGTLNAWAGKLAIHLHLNWSFWWMPHLKEVWRSCVLNSFCSPGTHSGVPYPASNEHQYARKLTINGSFTSSNKIYSSFVIPGKFQTKPNQPLNPNQPTLTNLNPTQP